MCACGCVHKKTAAVIVFPGTNCDNDTKIALEFMGFNVSMLSHNEVNLDKYDSIFLPGGFSFGDYIASGRLAKLSPVIDALKRYVKLQKGLVVGICNGFQILCESGLLKGSLMLNRNTKFVCRSQGLLFTGEFGNKKIKLPIAHKEGRYTADIETLKYLEKENMIFLKYDKTCINGALGNPNGSIEDIAGLYDRQKGIMGLMPHPERAVFAETGLTDGRYVFEFISKEIEAFL